MAEDIAARMRYRVTIQGVTTESDGQGGVIETWGDIATVWASIDTLNAYQKFQASQMQTPASHKIVMRHRADVTTANRLIFGERVFGVKEAIDPDGRGAFLHIKSLERIGATVIPDGARIAANGNLRISANGKIRVLAR